MSVANKLTATTAVVSEEPGHYVPGFDPLITDFK